VTNIAGGLELPTGVVCGQFSLGNSFWIHPLVELFVIRSSFAAWYPVSFFWWEAGEEAYLRYGGSDDIAGIMIS